MQKNASKILLLPAVLIYLVRWIGIRFFDSEFLVQAAPLHYLLLAALLLISVRREPKKILWMALVALGSFAVIGLAVAPSASFWGAAVGQPLGGVPLLAGLYAMIVFSGISALVALAHMPLWQKLTAAALLSLVFAFLLTLSGPVLDYWPRDSWSFSAAFLGGSALLAAAASGTWFGLRLRAGHFAIVLLLLEGIFLALMRL